MPGYAANTIMRLALAVERDIQIQVERTMWTEGVVDNFIDPRLHESVGRNDEAPHSIIANKTIDDLRNVMTQRWLAAGQPQVSYWRHGAGDLLDLLERHVAWSIQLFMIEARAANRVAARSDEQNHRTKALFAFSRSQQLDKLDSFVWHVFMSHRG